jgi:hypothetical protein
LHIRPGLESCSCLSPWSSLLMHVYMSCVLIIVYKLFVLSYNSSVNLLKKKDSLMYIKISSVFRGHSDEL